MKLLRDFKVCPNFGQIVFTCLIGLTVVLSSANPSSISLSSTTIRKDAPPDTIIGDLSLVNESGNPFNNIVHPQDFTKNLRAFYPFNGSTSDESGNAFHAQNNGAILTSDRFGNPESAYDFGGKKSYILVPPVDGMSDPYTLLLFYKTSSGGIALSSTPIDKPPSQKWGDRRIYIDDKLRVNGGVYDNGVKHIQSPIGYNRNQWYSAALIQAGGILKLYVDSKQVARRKAYSVSSIRSERWSIGYANMLPDWPSRPQNHSFSGQIDDIYIYSRELSHAELQYIHNYPSTLNLRKPSFSLPKGADNKFFVISGDKLKLRQRLDFTTKNQYEVLVSAITSDGISMAETFGINEEIDQGLETKIDSTDNEVKREESFDIPDVGITMIKVYPGDFLMGSPESEIGRSSDETQHLVKISKPYWLGKHEVTQAQWKKVMGTNPSGFKGDNLPVENVTWNDAMNFCHKLTKSQEIHLANGYVYSLPSEDQWEYACRAGTTTATSFGNSLSSRQANFNGQAPYGKAPKGPNLKQTVSVGSYPSNQWGFHNMHGNVSEWCKDRFWDDFSSTTSSRGGNWFYSGVICRAANHHPTKAGHHSSRLGFRLCLRPISKQITNPQSISTPTIVIEAEQPDLKKSEITKRTNFKIDEIGLEMIWVEPGEFLMGSPLEEKARNDDETRHKVTLTKGFWLGKHEVTQGQWKKLFGTNPSAFKGDRFPVENVSWHNANEFCKLVSDREKNAGRLPIDYQYCLPTEARWEYACRSGTSTATHFGGIITSNNANFMGIIPYGISVLGPDLENTTVVGNYKSNLWGFHDLHGNVWEWCQDWYAPYPKNSDKDPQGPNEGMYKIRRGGSWKDVGQYCRSAYRSKFEPTQKSNSTGFRLCLSPIEE